MDARRMLAWLAAIALGVPCTAPASEGVTLKRVDPALAGAAAGLAPGQRILAVRGVEGARRPVRDAFDAMVAEARWSRRGAVDLDTDAGPRHLPADAWGLDYRGAAEPVDAARLDALETQQDVAAFCSLSRASGAAVATRASAWLDWRCARLAAGKREWVPAHGAYLDVQRKLGDDADARLAVALAYARLAQSAKQWPEFDLATNPPQDGTEAAEIRWQLRNHVGTGLLIRSRFGEAAAHFESMRRDLPPAFAGTPLEAYLLVDYGFSQRQLEHFDAANAAFARAIAIQDRVAPISAGAAAAHTYLGLLRRAQGQAVEARKQLELAVAITRKISPDSQRVVAVTNNLALALWDAGDFVGAERAMGEALAISRRLEPGSFDVGVSLQNLGAMAVDRGDYAAAEARLRQAQAIFERVAPQSESIALGYHHLAQVEAERGERAAAEGHYRSAIELWSRLAPGTLRQAWSHHNLGNLAREQGRLDDAREHLLAAQAIRSGVAPGGLDEARGFAALGALEVERGERLAARGHLDLARDALLRIAPGSEHLAVVLHSLGELERSEGHAPQALAAFCEADRVLDLQRGRVSLSRESRSEYAAQHYRIPRDCARASLDAGALGPALDVMERSRARALRERLADFRATRGSLPAGLRDEGADLRARRAQLEARLSAAGDAGARDETMRRLGVLEGDEAAWRARLATQAPRLAGTLIPEVPGHAALLARVPPDAAVVVFLAGENESRAWLLSGAERRLATAVLPIGEPGLAELSGTLRRAIVERRDEAALRDQARRAHELLFGPFAASLRKARRVLIVPDRGLTLLPYAALVDGEGRYLVETHDLAIAPSVAIALENAARAGRDAASLLAVAVTPARALGAGGARREFAAIPAAAAEVAAIAGDYGRYSEVLVDAGATETQVRTAAARASVLHIASHGFFDAARPLDSGLLLVPGRGDDGVLHAWEVMSDWRLEGTRLVVLSACDTGVGEERAGEGLIGLGRAFQYAGAQGVLASLWPVMDRSTAELMRNFHHALQQGERPAAALQAAQRALLASRGDAGGAARGVGAIRPRGQPTLGHPFYWAGFEIFGQLP